MAKEPHRRGRSTKWIGYFLSFLAGAVLIFGGFIYLTREKPLSPEDFSKKVYLINQIIRSHLDEIAIPKKDILRHRSFLKKEGGLTWEQSLLEIQVLPSLSFSLIEENLRRGLSGLDNVSVQSSQVTESLHLEVKIQDRVTHQLTFIPSAPPTLNTALRPRIAIVIDDLGEENKVFQELLRWDLPLTFSILPFTHHAKAIALEAHQKGREIILHLPMEPHGYPKIRPGEGALLYEMDEERLLRQLSKDIDAIPYVKGASNHMGSRLMEDPAKMRIILSELKRRGIFFLDSRTTPRTVGLQTARSLGLRMAERTLFLDHSLDERDIKQKLEQLAQLSLTTGKAIGIGHPHPSTIKCLREMVPKMKEKGIDIVPLSSVIE